MSNGCGKYQYISNLLLILFQVIGAAVLEGLSLCLEKHYSRVSNCLVSGPLTRFPISSMPQALHT